MGRKGNIYYKGFTLFKRKNSPFWYFRRGENKRSLKTTSLQEAKIRINEILREEREGKVILFEKQKNLPLKCFREIYLDYSRKTKAPNTARLDDLVLRKLMEYAGEDIGIRNINARILDGFASSLLDAGEKRTSVNIYLKHLKAMLNKAMEWEYIKSVPKIKIHTVPHTPRYMTEEEVEKILEKSGRFRFVIEIALLTGLRRSDLCKLKRSDIDMKNRVIKVKIQKTGRIRFIPISDELYEILSRIKPAKDGRIIPYSPSYLTHRFKSICKSAGVDARFHDLRHTCATWLLNRGVPIEVVSKILGHTKISTTQIYADVLLDEMRKAVEKLKIRNKNGTVPEIKLVTTQKTKKLKK